MKDITKTLANWPTENLKVLSLFLERGTEAVEYDDVAKILGLTKVDDKAGKSIGGMLSTLRRNKINNEPLIISLGRVLGTRRLRWKLNPKAVSVEKSKELVVKILDLIRERGVA